MVDRRLLALYATTTVLMMTYGLLGLFLPLLAAEKGVTSGQVGVISVSTLLRVWSFLLYWVCCCIDRPQEYAICGFFGLCMSLSNIRDFSKSGLIRLYDIERSRTVSK